MLDAVHEVMSETQTTLNANLETIRKGLPEGWEEEPGAARLEKSLDDTAYNLDYLGESYAVHNIYYAAQILRHADETLVAIGKEQDIDLQGTSEQQIITGAFCATLCHKRVNVNVPPETVTLDDGREMPHLEHTEMDLGCTYCHSFGQHKEVSLLSPTPCDECHD
jgi:hypothetical protein